MTDNVLAKHLIKLSKSNGISTLRPKVSKQLNMDTTDQGTDSQETVKWDKRQRC